MSRRLLLSVAGMTLLSAAGCAAPLVSGRAPAATPSPSGSPSPSGTPTPIGRPPDLNVPNSALDSPSPSPVAVHKPLYQLPATDKVVALTLDDGPSPDFTPQVLDLLGRYGIRATFFIVGECASANRGLIKEISVQGHHLANHTWTHPDQPGVSAKQARSELGRTSDLLYQLSGKAPTWFRAPGGDFSHAYTETCAELGMRPMAWSVDPRDWSRPGTSAITQRVLSAVRPGSIVLNHDGGGNRRQTVAALKTYLPVLLDDGYRFTAPR